MDCHLSSLLEMEASASSSLRICAYWILSNDEKPVQVKINFQLNEDLFFNKCDLDSPGLTPFMYIKDSGEPNLPTAVACQEVTVSLYLWQFLSTVKSWHSYIEIRNTMKLQVQIRGSKSFHDSYIFLLILWSSHTIQRICFLSILLQVTLTQFSIFIWMNDFSYQGFRRLTL